jgi:hypothetical protein
VGVEYFEIIPSVKAMDSKVFGHVQSYFVGGFNNGYGKSSFTAKKCVDGFIFQPIIISQVSMSSIDEVSLKERMSLTNNALIYRPSRLPADIINGGDRRDFFLAIRL